MKIGYVRVSTQEQNTIRQELLMESLGADEVYIDRMSGKSTDRPELKKLMEYVRRGDTVIVESISRFARNTRDLLELVERLLAHGEPGLVDLCLANTAPVRPGLLEKYREEDAAPLTVDRERVARLRLELVERLTAKGVEFVSKKEAIDTTTPSGKFMLTIFGAVAELEREYILQRQQEGIAIAKAQGVYKGRKPIERPEFPQVAELWREGKITAVEAMRRLDMKPGTFYQPPIG